MSVYVDDVRHRFGRMIMCHMWADTLAELFAMADAIGVQRKWLQRPPKASWVHFDVSLEKKALAIARGATLTDKYGPLEHAARLDIASGNPERHERGMARLETIAKCRALPKRAVA